LRELPPPLRPRERLLKAGPRALSDAELLAILLRTGTNRENVLELSQRLLKRFGGLKELSYLHLKEWLEIPGIGVTKAVTVMAALELGQRLSQREVEDTPLDTPEAVYRYVLPYFTHEPRECFYVLGLDVKNQPVVLSLVGAGTLTRAPAHPREIFRPLIRAQAARGILCHNHPSGDPEPSAQDIELTQRLIQCGTLLDMPIVDHLIVTTQGFVSLSERGLFSR
jgi:DNA repair protein RadC